MVYDRILVPVESNAGTAGAVEFAVELADRWDASVDILRVVDDRSSLPLRSTESTDPEASLPDTVKRLAAEGGDVVTTHVVKGAPEDEILRYATEEDIDLVVMEQDDKAGLSDWLLDSVVDKVVRRTPVPVLVVPDVEHLDCQFERFLLPNNPNMTSGAAVNHAAAVAEAYGMALHVVDIIDLQREAGLFNAGGVPQEFIERKKGENESAAERVTGRVSDAVTDLQSETEVVHWQPHEALEKYVTDENIDFAAVSQYGQSRIVRRLLGDVTEHFLQTVSVPVLVVPNPD